MLPNELNYRVSVEQHRDRLRAWERRQLVQLASQAQGHQAIHQRVAGWLGGRLVRLGVVLQSYGPQPQPRTQSNTAMVTRVR